jgi:hypothetical protein
VPPSGLDDVACGFPDDSCMAIHAAVGARPGLPPADIHNDSNSAVLYVPADGKALDWTPGTPAAVTGAAVELVGVPIASFPVPAAGATPVISDRREVVIDAPRMPDHTRMLPTPIAPRAGPLMPLAITHLPGWKCHALMLRQPTPH